MFAIVLASLSFATNFAAAPHTPNEPSSKSRGREAIGFVTRGTHDDAQETWRAPDGQRGFGTGRTRPEIEHWVRSAHGNGVAGAQDRALLSALLDLAADVDVELARTNARYEESGQYSLLGAAHAPGALARTPESLAQRFHALAADAAHELTTVSEQVEPLARLLTDIRFRTRARAVDGVGAELDDLRGALALFAAQADGWVDLTDAEADRIARRADLAAARLRAIRNDLRALSESAASTGANAPWQRDFELLLLCAHRGAQDPELAATLKRLDDAEDSMSASLFTTRLAQDCAEELLTRAEQYEQANSLLQQAREASPELFGAGVELSPTPGISRSERRQRAARLCAQALELDPIGLECVWAIATSTDAAAGRLEARRYYDRFLALRGIRVQEARTYQGRTLSLEERKALEAVRDGVGKPPGT